jgi:hypothetical protein
VPANGKYSNLSLSEKAYFSTKSLREFSTSVTWTSVLILGMGWFIIIFWRYFRTITDPTLYAAISFLLVWFTIFLALDMFKGFRAYRKHSEWRKGFLYQQYILYFEATIPKGDTTAEKVFNLARLAIPELGYDYLSLKDKIKSFLNIRKVESTNEIPLKSLDYKIYSQTLDLALKTKYGYFIIKDFGDIVVTFDDLKRLIQLVGVRFSNEIFRVICVAKEYDSPFFQPEWLEKNMTNELLTRTERMTISPATVIFGKFGVDLLVDYSPGYSVLWVS